MIIRIAVTEGEHVLYSPFSHNTAIYWAAYLVAQAQGSDEDEK